MKLKDGKIIEGKIIEEINFEEEQDTKIYCLSDKEELDYIINKTNMRMTLIEAMKNNIESILIPMFGAHVGKVKPQIVSKMMWNAFNQVNNPPTKIDWDYVETVDMIPEKDFYQNEFNY